jgi:hypothetical protein
MDILNKRSDDDLLRSLLAELAKAKSELSCAKGDIDKINSRLSFLLAVTNTLIKRKED